MNFEEASYYCKVQVKYEVKCEDEQIDPAAEPANCGVYDSSYPIKREQEDSDSRCDFTLIEAESVSVKEEIDVQEHNPDWELFGGATSAPMINDGTCQNVFVEEDHSFDEKCDKEARCNCARRPFKTDTKSCFIRHTTCIPNKHCTQVYKCNECSYEAGIRRNFIRHYKWKHAKDAVLYKCHECSYQTKFKSHLTGHYKYKHFKDADVFTCKECSFGTRYKNNLTKHYEHKHKHAKDAAVFTCQKCSFRTKYKSNLIKHYKYKHAEDAKV